MSAPLCMLTHHPRRRPRFLFTSMHLFGNHRQTDMVSGLGTSMTTRPQQHVLQKAAEEVPRIRYIHQWKDVLQKVAEEGLTTRIMHQRRCHPQSGVLQKGVEEA